MLGQCLFYYPQDSKAGLVRGKFKCSWICLHYTVRICTHFSIFPFICYSWYAPIELLYPPPLSNGCSDYWPGTSSNVWEKTTRDNLINFKFRFRVEILSSDSELRFGVRNLNLELQLGLVTRKFKHSQYYSAVVMQCRFFWWVAALPRPRVLRQWVSATSYANTFVTIL